MPMLDCISTTRYKMNIFRLYLYFLILGYNFGFSEVEYNISELRYVDQNFYKLDSIMIDKGLVYQNINGNKLFLGRILKGKKAGEWFEFFNNSQIKIKGTFFQGDSVKTFSWFNSQGVLLKERIFHKNGITQKKYDYHYDNYLKKIEQRINGLKEGLWTEWFIDGKKKIEVRYKGDKKEGRYKEWYDDGKKKIEIKYRNDRLYSEILFWDKSTKKQYKGKTFEQNQNGTFFQWHDSPTLSVKSHLSFLDLKKHGKAVYWRENDLVHMSGNYNKNKKEGTWIFWNEKGNKISEKTFKKDTLNGLNTVFYPNAEKMVSESFQNGKKHGFHTSWYTNKNKKQEGEYVLGLKEGNWTYWHNNGKIKDQGEYQNNLKIGTWISGYDNGQKSNEGSYVQGKKEGKWIEWGLDGELLYKTKWKDGIEK